MEAVPRTVALPLTDHTSGGGSCTVGDPVDATTAMVVDGASGRERGTV